jgi:S-DNA-T family DNA segregation ATPase FtsK/SpoIIIE
LKNHIKIKNLLENGNQYAYFFAEFLLVLLGIFSILLFISLVTYSPSDAIWSESKKITLVSNIAGITGAWLADFFLKFFGLASFVIPFTLFLLGWDIHKQLNNEKQFDKIFLILRLIVFFIFLSFLSSFFSQNLITFKGAGGWIGQSIHYIFFQWFKDTSLLFYLGFIAISFSFFSRISLLHIFETTGVLTLKFFAFLKSNFLLYKQHRLDKKQAKKLKEERFKLHSRPLHANIKPPTIKFAKIKNISITRPPVQTSLLEINESILPPVSLLDEIKPQKQGYSAETLQALSKQLELELHDFGLSVEVVSVTPGPVITLFELSLAAGVKISQILNLSKDLARALLVESVRIVDVIPGKPVIGIEIPNTQREMISLRELLESPDFNNEESPLTMAIGKDTNGNPVMADLAKMPHLLVAGATGMGKSVGLNSMILSILYKATPKEVRMIMIDPKVVELTSYVDTPHLLTPVIIDMHLAASALRWSVNEMERRYHLLAKFNVRNIAGFNKKVLAAQKQGIPLLDPFFDPATAQQDETATPLETLPLIMIVIDEYADMLGSLAQEEKAKAKKVEALIIRLAQKARAAGMHLIIATQRPSVDVITGLIKSNVPTRIAFKVSSKIDSRTILDMGGAEQLLGMGDMLYTKPGMRQPLRVHGAFVDDEEVNRVIEFLKQHSTTSYVDEIINHDSFEAGEGSATGGYNDDLDELFDEVVAFVTTNRRVSISSIQRQFRIGYNRSARIVESMEAEGIVSEVSGNGQRDVLAPPPMDL